MQRKGRIPRYLLGTLNLIQESRLLGREICEALLKVKKTFRGFVRKTQIRWIKKLFSLGKMRQRLECVSGKEL